MSTVFKRLALGGRATVYKASGTYRPGAASAMPSITKMPVEEALASAKTKVTFLHADTLKGLPVNKDITTKTIDPYLAGYVKDLHKAYFGKKYAALISPKASTSTTYVLPTVQALELPSESQGWKLATYVKTSTNPAAGNGRFMKVDAPTVGSVICEKLACPFEENRALYPEDGVITFTTAVQIENYVKLIVSKGHSRETVVDLIENFMHGFPSDHVCLNCSTWTVNDSAEPNCKVELKDGKYCVITLRPIAAGEELFMDYAKFSMGDFYAKEFCDKNEISEVRTICLSYRG